ncbi:MAG: transglycosylase SLT domain-containing protein [Pyrinomonadaceae bacterium]|nr:transglycosylase SLT domain-containing protein [Pyrinomonadaceae bacterium]
MKFNKHPFVFVAVALCLALAALIAPFSIASCGTTQREPEAMALAHLRSLTRNGSVPAEDVVARIEAEQAGTRAGALARVVRARAKEARNDFVGAAALLDSPDPRRLTAIPDHVSLLRAALLEKAGRRSEARVVYESAARERPSSIPAREALLRAAAIAAQDGAATTVPALVKPLTDADDGAALLLAAQAYEAAGDAARALAAYRRLYFYAPASAQAAEAAAALARLNSTLAPATPDEATTRADKLFAAKRYADAASAYTDLFARFPTTVNAQKQLRRGIAAFNARRTADAIASLTAVPALPADAHAEALYHLAQTYATARPAQWDAARRTTEEMRRAHPSNPLTARALVAVGLAARDAKNNFVATEFFRTAVNSFPNTAETANAQFELAWAAHDAKNFDESGRLLLEHLANYADKNTDNRGRAGYWAARDLERAGRTNEAIVIYRAMQQRYDANWYGYLSKQRLDVLGSDRNAPAATASDATIARAVANLSTVTVAEETAGQAETESILRADELIIVGLQDQAFAELSKALETAPGSPRINTAIAQIYRAQGKNVEAINLLRASYPDYAQMKPAEMPREAWDVFYPLAHWEIIQAEARAKRLDPYTVAGLIRQESVFNPRAASSANAYGLMQLLIPTARATAARSGIPRDITVNALFEPRLNIQLGTAYMREQLNKYGRVEYLAAAYNAGPGRVVQWRASLPAPIDEWAEAIPFRETRGYVQGVVRNTMQYRRLYDEQGRFRPEVGSGANVNNGNASPANGVRPRRANSNEEE